MAPPESRPRNRDAAAFRREFHRVGEKVERDLLDRAAVGLEEQRRDDLGGELEPLVLGAGGDDAHRFGQDAVELDILEVELHAAGLDLRHVEDVVDHVQQEVSAVADVAAIFVIFVGAERAEHAGFHDLGEADDGVERRAQLVAHIGEEFRLGLIGVFGAGFFLGVFFRELGQLLGLIFQRLLRLAQVGYRRHQPLLALHQLFFVQLQRGDVGADRDIAAVLGAALADMQPAAVVELRLEGARARQRRPLVGERLRTIGLLPAAITIS